VSPLVDIHNAIDTKKDDSRTKTAGEFLECLGNRNIERMQELMEDSATYQVEGTQGFSGIFEGREEIRQHLAQLADRIHDTFDLLKVEDWLVGDTYVACIALVQMQREAQIYRSREMFLFGFWNGALIGRFTVFFFDEGAPARFLWPDQ
jgi:ketosteroid isomerase-like protein